MLQKGFFMTEPFNPSPFWDNTIVNLSGAQKFEEDTVFPAGRYSVDVQAGGTVYSIAPEIGGNITKNIIVNSPFIIRAYCGSAGRENARGVNPYSGDFKVNPRSSGGNVPSVNHIFGNAGSPQILEQDGSVRACSSGNCLGNGALRVSWLGNLGFGAGSCLHFLPLGGVFGVNYLYAFHVVGTCDYGAGGGSAYGGAGSSYAYRTTVQGSSWYYSSSNAGATPYGVGGAGVRTSGTQNGNSGTGPGYGQGGVNSVATIPAGAWFDGTQWNDSRVRGTSGYDGHIIVKYLGTIN